MKLQVYEQDGLTIVQGIITKKAPGKAGTNVEGKVLNITIQANVYNREKGLEEPKTMQISFWNEDGKQLANDANTRLNVGDYVSVLVKKQEKNGTTYNNGKAFKKTGLWIMDTGKTNDNNEKLYTNIFVNTPIQRVTLKDEDKTARIIVPHTIYDAEGNGFSTWDSIYMNSDATHPDFAKNVAKCLTPTYPNNDPSEKPTFRHTATLRCGNGKEGVLPDGKVTYTFSGYHFDVIDYRPKKEE